MSDSTTPRATIRVNLLRSHGTRRRYGGGCHCHLCRGAEAEYQRRYRAADPAKWAEYKRLWKVEHPSREAEYNRRWREAHREEAAACTRRWMERNPERVAEVSRLYRESHRAERAEHDRLYLADHLAEHACRQSNRRARKRGNGGSHTANDVRSQHERQGGKCYWCGRKVPWRKKHVDHVLPLALGGSDGPENIVVACPTCNLTKQAKHPMDFAGRML